MVSGRYITHCLIKYLTTHPEVFTTCDVTGENAIKRTGGEDRLSDSVGGLSCVSFVLTKVHMTCVQRNHVWMTN